MKEFLSQPMPWYVAGPLIGLTVPALLILGNKSFGISSSLRHICAACLPANIPFFQYNWKREIWNLFFVAGVLFGGIMAVTIFNNPQHIQLSEKTIAHLQQLGIQDFSALLPADIFSINNILSLKGFIFFVAGGFLVGFGTRYAGGCTSGHAIMGLSNLQWPSLIATCCFMIGGFISTWIILPFILKLFA